MARESVSSWTVELEHYVVRAKMNRRTAITVHREHTSDPKFVRAVTTLGHMELSDGTRLVTKVMDGEQGFELDCYGTLLREMIRYGVHSYRELTVARTTTGGK